MSPSWLGIGALRTTQVLAVAEDAQKAGVSAVLLAPMTYQALTDDEVFGLYESVTRELSVPLCVYDNPRTTHVHFTDELHGRIAELPNVAAVKIPPVPDDRAAARQRVAALRALLPDTVSVGVSGDWAAATGLNAGCDAWYSVAAWPVPRHRPRPHPGRPGRLTRLEPRLTPSGWSPFGSSSASTAACV